MEETRPVRFKEFTGSFSNLEGLCFIESAEYKPGRGTFYKILINGKPNPYRTDKLWIVPDKDFEFIDNKDIDDSSVAKQALGIAINSVYGLAATNNFTYNPWITFTVIKKVKFNGPATIVFFNDGTKTVLKCSNGDTYDAEKAVMIACIRKLLERDWSKSKFNKIIDNLPSDSEKAFMIGYLLSNFNGRNEELEKWLEKNTKDAPKNVIKPEKMSYREYIQKNYPDVVNGMFRGGVFGCPARYIVGGPCECSSHCNFECNKCFDQKLPDDAVDAKTGERIDKE